MWLGRWRGHWQAMVRAARAGSKLTLVLLDLFLSLTCF